MSGEDETARQRKAAELALDQLDWCVEYLRSIRKTDISRQLARNRDEIRRRLHADEDDDDRGDQHEVRARPPARAGWWVGRR